MSDSEVKKTPSVSQGTAAAADDDGVLIKREKLLVERLYCPEGHALITPENERFDDEIGIKLLVGGKRFSQEVYLSPFYRDTRKIAEREFDGGEILSLRCPTCTEELPFLAPHDCRPGAMYVTLLMDPDAPVSSSVCICNAWGCPASFLSLYSDVVKNTRKSSPRS